MPGDLPGGTAVAAPRAAREEGTELRRTLADFGELTKPGITFFILITAAVGFSVAPKAGFSPWTFLFALAGIGTVTAGGAALNNWMERDVDRLMRRTAGRPLPAGRITGTAAVAFGAGLVGAGLLGLWVLVRPLTALLGVVSLVSYVFVYTPLKRRTSLCTVVGGIPGALPVLGGWTAAGAALSPAAWSLFAIVFLWQIPHFLSLAWVYRDDYRRGGLCVLSAEDPNGGRTGRQSLAFSLALVPVSLVPALLGLSGEIYLVCALLAGAAYAGLAGAFLAARSRGRAQRLFLASLIYLPAVYLVMVLDRLPPPVI